MMNRVRWLLAMVITLAPAGTFAQGGATAESMKNSYNAKDNAEKAAEKAREDVRRKGAPKPAGASSEIDFVPPVLRGPNAGEILLQRQAAQGAQGLVDGVTQAAEENCSLPSGMASGNQGAIANIRLTERKVAEFIDLNGKAADNLPTTQAMDDAPPAHQQVNQYVLDNFKRTGEQLRAFLQDGTASATQQLDAALEKIENSELKAKLKKDLTELKAEVAAAIESNDQAKLSELETKLKSYLWSLGGRPALLALGITEEEMAEFEKNCGKKTGWF